MRETKAILASVMFAFFATCTLVPLAYAQTYPQTSNSGMTLEEELALAKERIKEVREHPGAGSGTPYLDASGVVGASVISAAIFGGIFVAFVARARQIEKMRMRERSLQ